MRIPAFIPVSIVLLLSAANAVASNLENVVKIDSGLVTGMGTTIRVYKGIPYAAPPIGELRWRAPQPVKPWTALLAANNYSAICTQGSAASRIPTNEDCLTLNVWTPAKRAGTGSVERLPVIFSIHGGGFEIGGSSPSVYDGERLASLGAVVVTINYRVGVLGFLAHPELGREAEGRSGNYGLLDMIAALKWTQQNIAAFGGDPNNVTIWGESAGGSA